jgi:hypothetical protein
MRRNGTVESCPPQKLPIGEGRVLSRTWRGKRIAEVAVTCGSERGIAAADARSNMIFQIKGTVMGLLDRGFLLQTGGGEPITVTTQTAGCDLGLNPGDVVKVLGGPVGRSTFASSTAFKVLRSGRLIEIPINMWRPPRQEPDQSRG